MPVSAKQPRLRKPSRRSTRVTGRKFASDAPMPIHLVYRLEPHQRIRPLVAMMASEVNLAHSLDLASPFVLKLSDLSGLTLKADFITGVSKRLQDRGVAHAAGPLPIHRLHSTENNGYPLRRTLLVVFNGEAGRITAELKEVSDILNIRGVGWDEKSALNDLELRFERLIQTKVRIPPHAQRVEDTLLVSIINRLIDWNRFREENPLPTPLWGKLLRRRNGQPIQVQWLLGPHGKRHKTTALPATHDHPTFLALNEGQWFKAVVKEYPDRVEWIEPPYHVPDPEDPQERKRAWEAIPTIPADQPDVWPLREE